MAGALKNSTTMISVSTTSSSTSTSNYGFPSNSFAHPKQPLMPDDQKAKLLKMHRDGKENAGIYVAVVLFVYFILVILLLCRYGKRRRTTEADLDSTTEQGHLHILNFHLRKVVTCGGDGCYNCFAKFCFCRRCCLQQDGSEKPVVVQNLEDYEKEVRSASSLLANGNPDRAQENKQADVQDVAVASKEVVVGGELELLEVKVEDFQNLSNENVQQSSSTPSVGPAESNPNSDNESIEED